jgi:hypothetical protein
MASAVFQLMLRLSMLSSRSLQASTHTRSWYLQDSKTWVGAGLEVAGGATNC